MTEANRNLLIAVITAVLTAVGSYLGFTRPEVNELNHKSEERHLISCSNARVNRALARDIAYGLLEPLPVPEGALPALRTFIEVANSERTRQKEIIEERTKQPVECLK